MRILFLLTLLSLAVSNLIAQTAGRSVVEYPNRPVFKMAETRPAGEFFDLAAGHELRHHYTHRAKGHDHLKYQQYYRGLRVLSGTVVFHLDGNRLYASSGYLGEFDDLDVRPRLSTAQAEALARLRVASELGVGPGARLEVSARQTAIANASYPERGGGYGPVYVYTIKNEHLAVPVNKDVIIDANSGRVVTVLDNIHTESVTGHGNGHYHQNLTFPVDSLGPNNYELTDRTRGQGIFANNLSNFGLPVTDDDNDWTYEEESHAAMIDGYMGSILFYEFLQDRFDRNSLDNEGVPLIANMNRHTYVNAFWNGESANFGNGNCENYTALTVYEIVGHEYAHGLTDYTSNLIYYSESGALNEAISDIMGKGLEYYYDADHFNWRIGNGIRRNNQARYFRSMSNPHQRQHPKFYQGTFWRYDESDNAGVHSKSGVLNYWFYLLAEGDRGRNEDSYNYDVNPIGMDSALQLVYLLEAAYLTENSTFFDAFEYTKLAAAELFGENSVPYDAAIEAWKIVGLTDDFVPEPEEVVTTLDFGAIFRSNTSQDFRLCFDELSDMSVEYANFSDTLLAAGTIVRGTLYASYAYDGEDYADTLVLEEVTLDSELGYFDRFTMQAALTPAQPATSFSTISELVFVSPAEDTLFDARESRTLFLNTQQEVAFSFDFSEYSFACATPEIVEETYYFSLPRCAGATEGSLRLVYTGLEGGEIVVDQPVANAVSSSTALFSPTNDVDLAPIGGLSNASLSIYYADGASEELLYAVDFSAFFAETISEVMTEDFTNEASARQLLGINGCASCTTTFGTEALVIHDSTRFFQSEECVPVADLMNTTLWNQDDRLTQISLCVDTDGIENPYLVFDLTQEDNPRFTRRQNLYQHIVEVYADDRSLLAEPITTTGGEMVAQEVRLGDGFSGEIRLWVVSSEVNTIIDNLGIVSGSPSRVRGLPAGAFGFRFANPVGEQLQLTALSSVPAGTTVTLFSTSGQVLRRAPMSGTRLELELGHLPAGLYFLSVSDGATFRWTGKAVKR